MADNLCYIKTKNSLKKREKRQKIKQAIKEKVMSIQDHTQLRQNGTFVIQISGYKSVYVV